MKDVDISGKLLKVLLLLLLVIGAVSKLLKHVKYGYYN